jgi:hypothetical protein
MPDIQTAFKQALSRTLQEWDDDGEIVSPPSPTINTTINNSVPTPSQGIPMKKTFGITNNISRVTFDYIKNNPGSTRKEIIEALGHQGFAGGSTSSLIAQMRRNNMVHETNSLYYADIPEYRPIKSLKALRKIDAPIAPPKRKYEKKAVTGIGALLREKLENMPEPSQAAFDAAAYAMGTPARVDVNKRMISLVRVKTPEDVLKDMTVYQAHDLYRHLKEMFGG